jgi:hypothetical protein
MLYHSYGERERPALYPRRLHCSHEETLPDAEKDTEEFREVEIDVPRWFKARIRFKRFHFQRGRMSRWFWTAESAERIE